jgi:hypothetical protein
MTISTSDFTIDLRSQHANIEACTTNLRLLGMFGFGLRGGGRVIPQQSGGEEGSRQPQVSLTSLSIA